jgi:hypothetical protein
LRRLRTTHQHLNATLASILSPQELTTLINLTQHQAEATHQLTKNRQKKKLAHLITPSPPTHPPPPNPKDRWLYDQSSVTLTQPQINILTKGLAFRPTPKRVPIIDFITATEKAAATIGTHTAAAADLRNAVAHILSHLSLYRPP